MARLQTAGVMGGRIYPMRLRQDVTLPAGTYSVVSKTRDRSRAGAVNLATMRMQVSAVDSTYAGAKAAAGAVRTALQDYAGNGINSVFVSGDRDFDEADTGRVRVVMDAMVDYEEV